MKNFTLLKAGNAGFCMLFSIFYAGAQGVTSTSGYYPSSAAYYESLPAYTITPQSDSLVLPVEVDNSIKPYFPQRDNTDSIYVYHQKTTASCQNVATAWYTFTYEINRLRNVTSNLQTTRYVPNFSFNHLNHGYSNWQGYTSLEYVQKFLMQTGGMSDAEFDGSGENDILDLWRWPTGYDYYYNAFKNKLHYAERFDMSLPTNYTGQPEVKARLVANLSGMKHHLYDHGVGDANNGGLITFGVNFETGIDYITNTLSAHIGEMVMSRLNYCDPGGHAMTIVGYSDSVMYDWGGDCDTVWCEKWQEYEKVPKPDGRICDTCDNNFDGIIDMQDWETGAVKVYNSYGPNGDFHGYRWMMYCTLPFKKPVAPQWWGGHEFCVLTPKAEFTPELALKVKVDAPDRDDLRLGCGYAPLANYSSPAGTNDFMGYQNDGGSLPMQGKDKNGNLLPDSIEVMFDYSYFYWNTDFGKAFFINRNDSASGGTIKYLALVDYRWNEKFELPYAGTMPFSIGNPSAAGIEYDLIVQGPQAPAITQNTTFTSNMVSRFTPTIDSATLTINDGVRIDMYNSKLIMQKGSSLSTGDSVTFAGKRGSNEIDINGNISLSNDVNFVAADGVDLKIVVDNNSTLTIADGVKINMDNCELIVQNGSSLVVGNNVTFIGKRGASEIAISGDISLGKNARFIAEDGMTLTVNIGSSLPGLTITGAVFTNSILENSSVSLSVNECQFTDANVHAYKGSLSIANSAFDRTSFNNIGVRLTVNNSTFDSCQTIESSKGKVTVTNSVFNHSNLYLENQDDNDSTATVTNCEFTGDALTAIDIQNYGKFFIENNTINGYHRGIQLMFCGSSNNGNQSVYGNTITNALLTGINVYNSYTSIAGNHIADDYYGIRLLNNSNTALLGNASAQTYQETQTITNNTNIEVYASQNCFPWYFRYNVIVDEDNSGAPDDPLVYYDPDGNLNLFDVRYNCWGKNFNYQQDFYPSGYIYSPTWCPSGVKETAITETASDEDLYNTAMSLIEQENYTEAKTTLQSLIEQYPDSKYAEASIKELFRLEKYAGNNYNGLKQYYTSNATIQSDTVLARLGDFFANKCDVVLENWQTAINWYENKILYPETLEDSVFAVIDLGYLYFLMENSGQESAFTGKLLQYKPNSLAEYTQNRDYLLSLLPEKSTTTSGIETTAAVSNDRLLQNNPNPFSDETTISFKLTKPSSVDIKVYNQLGALQQVISQSGLKKGLHTVNFNASNLPAGIYYYSMEINGRLADTKKMILIK
ncbi:MAG: T9SS type A sorting domain-containing protein [Lentimicrobiaceae bacterium]|nr:T9SS type A sorting domain-containing protein [Lentimicrobiaceae bacterium]